MEQINCISKKEFLEEITKELAHLFIANEALLKVKLKEGIYIYFDGNGITLEELGVEYTLNEMNNFQVDYVVEGLPKLMRVLTSGGIIPN